MICPFTIYASKYPQKHAARVDYPNDDFHQKSQPPKNIIKSAYKTMFQNTKTRVSQKTMQKHAATVEFLEPTNSSFSKP